MDVQRIKLIQKNMQVTGITWQQLHHTSSHGVRKALIHIWIVNQCYGWFEVVFWLVLRHNLEYNKNRVSFETL